MNRYKLFGCDSKITLMTPKNPTVVEVELHGTNEGCEIKKAKRLPKPGERLIKEFQAQSRNRPSQSSRCSSSFSREPANKPTARSRSEHCERANNIQDIIDKIASDLEETSL